MTRFSKAITRIRNYTSSAFVNGESSGGCSSCLDAGAEFPSGSIFGVGTGMFILKVNGRRYASDPSVRSVRHRHLCGIARSGMTKSDSFS